MNNSNLKIYIDPGKNYYINLGYLNHINISYY